MDSSLDLFFSKSVTIFSSTQLEINGKPAGYRVDSPVSPTPIRRLSNNRKATEVTR